MNQKKCTVYYSAGRLRFPASPVILGKALMNPNVAILGRCVNENSPLRSPVFPTASIGLTHVRHGIVGFDDFETVERDKCRVCNPAFAKCDVV